MCMNQWLFLTLDTVDFQTCHSKFCPPEGFSFTTVFQGHPCMGQKWGSCLLPSGASPLCRHTCKTGSSPLFIIKLITRNPQEALCRDQGKEVTWQGLVCKESELPAHVTCWHGPDSLELITYPSSIWKIVHSRPCGKYRNRKYPGHDGKLRLCDHVMSPS